MIRTARAAAAGALAISAMFAPFASADNEDSTGLLCGFSSTSDDTGLISQDPTLQMGEMDGGPLLVGDFVDDASAGPSHTTTTDGTLHCWIQVNSDAPGHFPNAKSHCDFTGHGVIVGACQIEYNAALVDNVYLCAMLETHGQTYVYDDDANSANGDQCSLAISAGA